VKTVNRKRVATTRAGRNGVHKPKPSADDQLGELVSAMNAEEVQRFAATIEKHSKHDVVVLVFPGIESEALRVVAERENGGSVEEYIKEATHAAMQNDLDSLRWDLARKKGGAR
jgi:hypothetical protein